MSFFQNPAVRAAIAASGVNREIQKAIVFEDTMVGVVTETRGRLLGHGYDPVGAGSTNWAILMIPDGSEAAVCYSTGVVTDKQGADWYYDGELVFTLYQPCPSEDPAAAFASKRRTSARCASAGERSLRRPKIPRR